VTKVAIIHDFNKGGNKQAALIKAAATNLQFTEINARTDAGPPGLDVAISNFANPPDGKKGLIVTAGSVAGNRRDLIVSLAKALKLPAIYPNRMYPTMGGLISKGADVPLQYGKAGVHVAKIMRTGLHPPYNGSQGKNTNFELVINLLTAKALGLLPVAPSLLAQADLVIT
jgi:putative tryptophan/tyrosine transport system substrate-binding protein